MMEDGPSLRVRRGAVDASGNDAAGASRTLEELPTPRTDVIDRSLVRGVASADVLAGFATIFESSAGCAATYALSRPVARLDGFLSHSWRDSRWKTWLALAYHYNLGLALGLALLAALAVFALEDGGARYLVPPLPVFTSVDGHVYMYSVDPGLAGTVVFLAALALGGWFTSRTIFVDKCCIDQVDDKRKRAGIRAIPEVLCRSRSLLLVYERDYFERLWCVFELALFAADALGASGGFAPGLLEMLPVERALAAVTTFFFFGVGQQLMDYCQRPGSIVMGGAGQMLVMAAAFAIPCVYQLRSLEQRRKILRDLSTFRLADAKCSDPRDREYVEQLIAERWAARGGLAGFERDVRRGPIFHAIQRELGGSDGLLRYRDQVVCTFGVLLLGLGLHAHNAHATSHMATTFLGVFFAMPLAITLHARITVAAAELFLPFALRLVLSILLFVACIMSFVLPVFHFCRAPCRELVGVGCLRG